MTFPAALVRAEFSGRLLILAAGWLWAAAASADDTAVTGAVATTEYKLTPSYYRASDGNDAADLNLRIARGPHTAWLGQYRDRDGFSQARTGYEYREDAGVVRVVWSGQLASRGFLGGSATAEIGAATFAIVGFGRTNLRDYYNLNFDPNDAITVGIGSRALARTEWGVTHIWDDRLGTRQHVSHVLWRMHLREHERLSIDASYKHGLSADAVMVGGYALSLTYDVGDYFIRIARDQHANFTAAQLTRFSAGRRF